MIANLKLGEHQIDFAIGEFQPTTGVWDWLLIKLALPKENLYSESGDMTIAFSRALQKVNDWRIWIQSHLDRVRLVLPGISPLPSVAIIIGRREFVRDKDKERLVMLRMSNPGVVINTYDSLLDSIRRESQ